MEIKNKMESIDKIKELNLNKFPEELFKYGEEEKVKEFLRKYPAPYYAIRDKSKSGGTFKLKVNHDDVLKEISEYTLFSINVSSANYSNNQVLVGEIEICSNSDVYLTLSTSPTASVRDALNAPTFNLKTDIFDKRLDEIPEFDYVYQYIVSHELTDIIVEFSLFNKCVGINNKKIIIYELRTDY